jgi:L,D-peptidoglycan transpeptidase YkuD (ErfK/YbiS/YcfS/YnhG family)
VTTPGRRRGLRTACAVAATTALGLSVGACGSSPDSSAALGTPQTPASSTAISPTPSPVATTSLAPPRLPAPTSRTTSRARTTTSSGGATGCAVPSGVQASQVVVVRSSGSSATIRACRRSAGRYLLALGPYSGHVGLHGVSASKGEGDLRTPAGVFPLRGGFGRYGNPGLDQGWFTVDSRDVWVDDSGSSLYNTHQRSPASGRWSSAESLDISAYNYAQVIGYNESRTPGRGSAIFLHVDHGSGTAGCVSLPTANLLSVLRWEHTGAVIAIS